MLEAAAELPGLRPLAVADRDRARADALAAPWGLEACEPERLLADPRVAVEAVATPPFPAEANCGPVSASRSSPFLFSRFPLSSSLFPLLCFLSLS